MATQTDQPISGLRSSLKRYLVAITEYHPRGLALALLLMLLVGFSEGVGLLLLIPLLELLDISTANSPSTVEYLASAFRLLGLPLTLETVLLIYLLLVGARTLLIYARDIHIAALQLGFVDQLRKQLNHALGQAQWQFLSRRRGSDLLHVLTADINRVSVGTHAFLQLLVGAAMALIQITLALFMAPGITALTLLLGGGLLLLFLPHLRRAQKLGQTFTRSRAEVFGSISEFLAGIKLAKSYTQEQQHQQIFDRAVDDLRARILDFARQGSLLRGGYQFGAALALSVVLYLAITVNHTSGPTLLVLILIFARLLPQLSAMQQQSQQLLHSLPAFDAAMHLQADCEDAAETTSDGPSLTLDEAIELKDLGFSYPGETPQAVLHGLQLRIQARATTAVVGPSGSGKSTLADLLVGLLKPTQGEIRIDGQPLTVAQTRAWRRQVAYVPQEVFLFHDTLRANLLWVNPQANEAELWRVLKLTAIDQVVAALPDGLDTLLGDRGIRLSGGERQRLALARALLRQPSLLILDEATSALDSEHERRIQHAIESLHGKLTIVVIAHRLSTVRNADQLVVLESGHIVEQGSWASLSGKTDGRFRAMLNT